MIKLLGRFTIYTGGGSGADAPPMVYVYDYNSESARALDFNTTTENLDFNG